jgi:2-polyprenyl-3-methyl-5-hydroxy-6-metoxy-1,4-benzoquinol methylase
MPKIGIVVVAYNAASTLASVLDRIPQGFRSQIDKIIVSDDYSSDSTYFVGLGYQQTAADLPLTVVRTPQNLGYGGNQKACYQWAMQHDLDIVVLLHGDGQYAPELLPEMVAPLIAEECDAVFGSRMLERGAALKGGMPRYKYIGNRVLTRVENAALGTELSEFHSGYRAYRVASLRKLDLDSYSNDFDFDTEIIIGLVDQQMVIREIPIPTYYGDEICYVNGMRYARQVVQHVVHHRLHQLAPSALVADTTPEHPEGEKYAFKEHASTSHGRLLARLAHRKPLEVLDVGCGAGFLAARLRAQGHRVTGIDAREPHGVRARTDAFFLGDLAVGLPNELPGTYDVVILADVLEHLRHPEVLLDDVRRVLAPGGKVLVSLPNFAHWYPRARVAAGAFDYDEQGILDEDHVRFFTRRSMRQLFNARGWRVLRTEAVGVPWETILGRRERAAAWLRSVEGLALLLRPTLFAYQFITELSPQPAAVASELSVPEAEARVRTPRTLAGELSA